MKLKKSKGLYVLQTRKMMLKHAFLITAHAYFEQLSDIISLLSAPNHYFFINIDKKNNGGGGIHERVRREIS